MIDRLLEVGVSANPALRLPGSIFDQEILYTGVDVRHTDLIDGRHRVEKDQPQASRLDLAASDISTLPFPDEKFSHVIMRSLFGEYTGSSEQTGSSVDETSLGVYEIFRVLKPNGVVAIAEENTAFGLASPAQLGSLLLDAGFKDLKIFPCQDMENDYWRAERTRYWGIDTPRASGGFVRGTPIDARYGFLIKGVRPDVEVERFTEEISDWKQIRQNAARGKKDPYKNTTRKLQLQRAAGDRSRRTGTDPLERITIVTKDGPSMDLHSYYDARSRGEAERYFE